MPTCDPKDWIWGSYPMPAEEPTFWQIGPLNVWIKVIDNDVWIARTYGRRDPPEGDSSAIALSDDAKWTRWAFEYPHDNLISRPLFPDRPVVVEPETTFVLTPGSEAKIYVRCPLWLRIDVVRNKPLPIEEIPTMVMSNTWFGTFTEGELCYWASTRARRQINPKEASNHMAICPITIFNTSEDELRVEKICLHVEGLSLYKSGSQLWADETHVYYRGKRATSEIKASGESPTEAPNGELVSEARDPMHTNLTARTFAALKSLTGLTNF